MKVSVYLEIHQTLVGFLVHHSEEGHTKVPKHCHQVFCQFPSCLESKEAGCPVLHLSLSVPLGSPLSQTAKE